MVFALRQSHRYDAGPLMCRVALPCGVVWAQRMYREQTYIWYWWTVVMQTVMVVAVIWRSLHFFHVCSVTFYVHGGSSPLSAAMAHSWNYLLAFYLQHYKTIDWYTTTKHQQYFARDVLNLPRCTNYDSLFRLLQQRLSIPPPRT